VDLITPFSYGVTGYRLKWAPNFDKTFNTLLTSTNVGFLDQTINQHKVDVQPMGGTASNGGRNIRIVFNPSNPSYGVALSGTVTLSASTSVTTSTDQTSVVFPGNSVAFAAQPGVSYTVASLTSSAITLTTAYTGATGASTGFLVIADNTAFWLQLAQVTGASETLVGAPTLVLPDGSHQGVGIVTIHGTAPGAVNSTGSLQIDLPFLMEDFHIHNEGTVNLFVATEQNGAEAEVPPDTAVQYSSLRGTQGSIWVRGQAASGGAATPVLFSATCTRAFPR
jgi:hypothetical protein